MLQRAMRRRTFLAALAGLVAYSALGANKCATLATLALRNARLWDGSGSPPRAGMTIAVIKDTIVAIAPDGEVDLGQHTEVIDCRGAFVMPGVIDTHCHVTLTLVQREPLVRSWLQAGVTTVRDTGTIRQGPFLIRDLARELGPSPRIISSGPIVTAPGGYPITRGPLIGEPVSFPVATPAEATAAVHEVLDAGADFIKVAVETGTPDGHLLEDVGAPALTPDQLRAIVAAAHSRSALVSAHVSNGAELRAALAAGVDSMAHTPLDSLSEALLRDMVARGASMPSTLNIWGRRPFIDTAMNNVQRFVNLGGVLAMGTDYPFQPQPGMPLAEMALLEDAGLTPEQVLLASTRDAAVVCGRGDLGVIQEGRRADMLVVGADPLAGTRNLGVVTTVIQDGVRVR